MLEYHTASVEVQFTGNAKTYHFLTDSVQWVALSNALDAGREIRVVTPGKLKDDRLSVSVATVVGACATAHPDAVLPIVCVVPADGLETAKSAVALIEQRAAGLAAVQGATA